ncbi:hypothetical protein K1X84_03465 [bacterium]|nr:hypothetical protein [bacterium]
MRKLMYYFTVFFMGICFLLTACSGEENTDPRSDPGAAINSSLLSTTNVSSAVVNGNSVIISATFNNDCGEGGGGASKSNGSIYYIHMDIRRISPPWDNGYVIAGTPYKEHLDKYYGVDHRNTWLGGRIGDGECDTISVSYSLPISSSQNLGQVSDTDNSDAMNSLYSMAAYTYDGHGSYPGFEPGSYEVAIYRVLTAEQIQQPLEPPVCSATFEIPPPLPVFLISGCPTVSPGTLPPTYSGFCDYNPLVDGADPVIAGYSVCMSYQAVGTNSNVDVFIYSNCSSSAWGKIAVNRKYGIWPTGQVIWTATFTKGVQSYTVTKTVQCSVNE